MIIFRPYRGSTYYESLYWSKEYNSLGELIDAIVKEHNDWCSSFQIKPCDIHICERSRDERIGWHDSFMLCYESYDRCSALAQKGYDTFFTEHYTHPCGVIGWFSTDYEQKWTKEELKQIMEGVYK